MQREIVNKVLSLTKILNEQVKKKIQMSDKEKLMYKFMSGKIDDNDIEQLIKIIRSIEWAGKINPYKWRYISNNEIKNFINPIQNNTIEVKLSPFIGTNFTFVIYEFLENFMEKYKIDEKEIEHNTFGHADTTTFTKAKKENIEITCRWEGTSAGDYFYITKR